MTKSDANLEKYKISIELLRYEGEMLWQIMSAYMLVNTIFLGFISQVTFKDFDIDNLKFQPICFYAGLFGLILIIPWLGTFLRNSVYYHFRMEQAKESEPDNWDLLRNRGKDFADGLEVKVNETKMKIGFLGRWMRNKRAIYLMIGMFGIIYSLLIILFGPWWN